MTQRPVAAILMTLVAVLLAAPPVSADSGHHTTVIVQEGTITKARARSKGTAQLTRSAAALWLTATLRELTPGNVYSVWWILIEEGNAVLVVNATGGIANAKGELVLSAVLGVGTYPAGQKAPNRVLFPSSLVNPWTALVLNHVLDHGPPVPGKIFLQLNTVDEACAPSPPDGCPLQTENVFETP